MIRSCKLRTYQILVTPTEEPSRNDWASVHFGQIATGDVFRYHEPNSNEWMGPFKATAMPSVECEPHSP